MMGRWIRLRLFLLGCVLVIGANAVLVMGGHFPTGVQGGDGAQDGWSAVQAQWDCGYGRRAEKR